MNYKPSLAKTFFSALISILFIVSCKPAKTVLQVKVSKKDWTTNFRTMVVYSCLCELTENETRATLKKHGDISLMTRDAFLLTEYAVIADTLGRQQARKIKTPYPDTEISQSKTIFSSCLSLYNDKYIKKAALKNYRSYRSGSNN
jgi:hypothetical protein